ncbi:FKBP-type peptidyl-prolyl cis-trans isomerase [Mucilaginibacter sp. dw_454]|uniref:FKBP-type peptidyl-prolyl cis-trans isomerase n=1 Tax=Mucilaginibacter sp. dw_454 TaxID=2720079 RepID=UPI001BD5135D|nr:FKBP-type peptidyl-prolyl cis-trans isomerase [Mucilaginibacter sp. dw_454]
MNRVVVIILFFIAGLTACKKEDNGGSVAYKAQAAEDDLLVSNFLKANPTLTATKIDTSGVYYVVEQPGTGTDLFTNSTQVTVGYTGRLINKDLTEQVFTQTKDSTSDFHPSFVLSQVILGWRLGIPFGKKGGTIRLLIPSRYAYGPAAQPLVGVTFGLKNGLPANAVVDFDITLYDVIN